MPLGFTSFQNCAHLSTSTLGKHMMEAKDFLKCDSVSGRLGIEVKISGILVLSRGQIHLLFHLKEVMRMPKRKRLSIKECC